MEIKVKQAKTSVENVKVFIDAYEMGRNAALKAWGDA